MENDFAKGLSVQYLGANGLMTLPKKYNDKLTKDLYPASYLSLWKGKKLVAVPVVVGKAASVPKALVTVILLFLLLWF